LHGGQHHDNLLAYLLKMAEDSFGRRLRAERERRRISLEAIAANTKIGIGLLKGLERDDVSRWPSGIFRRSFIRGYAEAIGLDGDETVREFLERFPDPSTPAAPISETEPGKTNHRAPARPMLRLALADSPQPFSGGRLLSTLTSRLAAVAWDAGSMLAIALTAFIFIENFWAPLAAGMLCYYLGGVLILGNTPGVCLFAPRSGGHDDKPPRQSDDDRSISDFPSQAVLRRGFIS
jgi:transcriptional regulator with XRE-family HTH domain